MSTKRINNKKKGRPQVSDNKPLLDITEDEQWRIVNETGLLHKVKNDAPRSSPDEEEPALLISVLLAVPLTILHGILEYVVHYQYDFLADFSTSRVLKRQVPLAPVLTLFIYITTKFKDWKVTQAVFFVASIACGCTLIHFSQEDQTFGTMLKTPGLAVLWIYLVIQMKLSLAVVSLLGTLLYFNKHWFQGNIKSLEF